MTCPSWVCFPCSFVKDVKLSCWLGLINLTTFHTFRLFKQKIPNIYLEFCVRWVRYCMLPAWQQGPMGKIQWFSRLSCFMVLRASLNAWLNIAAFRYWPQASRTLQSVHLSRANECKSHEWSLQVRHREGQAVATFTRFGFSYGVRQRCSSSQYHSKSLLLWWSTGILWSCGKRECCFALNCLRPGGESTIRLSGTEWPQLRTRKSVTRLVRVSMPCSLDWKKPGIHLTHQSIPRRQLVPLNVHLLCQQVCLCPNCSSWSQTECLLWCFVWNRRDCWKFSLHQDQQMKVAQEGIWKMYPSRQLRRMPVYVGCFLSLKH